MTRAMIRELKRQVVAGMRPGATQPEVSAAREAAALLLQRSIAMKHDRLSLHRLVDALKLGATVDARAWRHCTAIAMDASRVAALRALHPSLPTLVQEMSGRS